MLRLRLAQEADVTKKHLIQVIVMLYSATACLGKKPSCVLIAMIALASTWITLYAGEHYLMIFSSDIKISDYLYFLSLSLTKF